MQDLSLATIEVAFRALEAASTVQQVINHLNAAKMAEVYAKQARLGKDLELKVFQYVKKAERKLGEMLAAAKAAGQIKEGNRSGSNQYKSATIPKENSSTFTLKEAGINPKLSARAQKLATVPKEEFDKAVAEGREPRAMESANGKTNKPNVAPNRDVSEAPEKPRKDASEPYHHEHEDEMVNMSDAGMSQDDIAAHFEISPHSVRRYLERGRIRRASEPAITRDMLSLTAQQKYDLVVKQEKNRLGLTFNAVVQARVNQRVKEYLEEVTPKLKKEQDEAQRIIKARKGIMGPKTYKKILACLHPDRGLHPARDTDGGLKKAYEEAFNLFSRLEKLVLDEKASPTNFAPPIPATMAEWEEMKRKTTEARRAAKKNKATSVGVRQ